MAQPAHAKPALQAVSTHVRHEGSSWSEYACFDLGHLLAVKISEYRRSLRSLKTLCDGRTIAVISPETDYGSEGWSSNPLGRATLARDRCSIDFTEVM